MRRSGNEHQNRAGYKIPVQPEGTRVSFWADPRGPNHGVVRTGTIESHKGETLLIVWDDDIEHYEMWPSAEVRYRIERGQMNLKKPPKQGRRRIPKNELLCRTCGEPRSANCTCIRPGATKPEEWGQKVVPQRLTPSPGHDMMEISIEGNALTKKGHMMARKAKVVEEDEVEDLETSEEVIESAGTEMLTAKQAATLLKTDGRTLRKFLRKKNGVIGQGQRWEIDPDHIPALREEFEAFQKGGTKSTEPKADKTKKKSTSTPAADDEGEIEVLPEADLDEIEDLDFGDDD